MRKEIAIRQPDDLAMRQQLAIYLHEHHPRTAHPPKPGALARAQKTPKNSIAAGTFLSDHFGRENATAKGGTSPPPRRFITRQMFERYRRNRCEVVCSHAANSQKESQRLVIGRAAR